jgi:capsular polysaccharide biosynthesis protein
MELKDYLNVLVKRGWIILLVAVITASSAFVFGKMQTVTYRSSIWLNVWPGRPDWGLQQTIKGLMRNYSGQIKSRDAAQEVISRNQLDMTVDSLLDEMTVSPIESDFLLQIDVDDIDPQRAQVIAQTAAEVFVEKIRVYMLEQDKSDRVDVNIRDDATPATVFWPKTKLLTLAGGVLGLIAGALVVFGLEWLARDIIREGRDIERHVGLTVLGSIPRVVAKPR